MINRDKYAEYLDSALIHKFLNGLDPKLNKKLLSIRFHSPFIGLGQRFFDQTYKKEGIFIVRNKVTGEFVRFGHAVSDVKTTMYNYLRKLPEQTRKNCDCSIITTHNGEQKEISLLLKKVIKFELEYHNYFLLRDQIEDNTKVVEVNSLERVFPYTGRESTVFKGGKEWTIPFRKFVRGVYIVWKDGKLDYVGKGNPLAKRLYAHLIDMGKYKEYIDGKEYSLRHVYYPPEEVKAGRIKFSIIPMYRKMVSNAMPWQDDDGGLREENDLEFDQRILDLESRIMSEQKSPQGKLNSNFEQIDPSREKIDKEDNSEDPPF